MAANEALVHAMLSTDDALNRTKGQLLAFICRKMRPCTGVVGSDKVILYLGSIICQVQIVYNHTSVAGTMLKVSFTMSRLCFLGSVALDDY